MTIRSETRIIGNTKYTVQQLDLYRGRAVLARLKGLAGPLLRGLLSEVVETARKARRSGATLEGLQGALGGLDVEALGAAALETLERLGEADIQALEDAFAPCTLFEPPGASGPRKLDKEAIVEHFSGDGMLEYFRWLAFCVEVNYRESFFGFLTRSGTK